MPINLFIFRSRFSKSLQAANDARDRKDWAVALKQYMLATSIRPNRSKLFAQAGNMAKELGDYMQAELLYLYAYRASGVDDIYLQMGHLRKLQGKMDEALSFYALADEVNPQNADTKDALAALQKQLEEAPPIGP